MSNSVCGSGRRITFRNANGNYNFSLYLLTIRLDYTRGQHMDFLTLVSEVGFPIAGALAAGGFVFLTLKFILAGVTGAATTLKNIIAQLDNRVQTMNNDLVKIDALLSYTLGVKPNVDRIAANEGKEDARRD